ncbi:MAG: hypothetical protein WD355_02445 [Balneolaceae bacterium]
MMEINNITNHLNKELKDSEAAGKGASSSAVTNDESKDRYSDKVTLRNGPAEKTDQIFARLELEKLNHNSFEKLKGMKAKLAEYEAAKEISQEKADQTEMGKLLNNPDVWGRIADKIL